MRRRIHNWLADHAAPVLLPVLLVLLGAGVLVEIVVWVVGFIW